MIDNAEIKYCHYCGSELKKVENGYFNQFTGEKAFDLECPINPCEHTGHKFQKLSKLEYIFSRKTHKCVRCGFKKRFD